MNPNTPDTPEPAPLQPPPTPAPAKTNWLLFFGILLAPTVLTMICAALGPNIAGLAPIFALIGGVISGISCGTMVAERARVSFASKFVLFIVSAFMLGVASISMSWVGCLASGFQI